MNLLVVSRCFFIVPFCCDQNDIKYPPNKFLILKAELMFLFFILDLKLAMELKKLFVLLVLLCISSGSEKRLLMSESDVDIDPGSHHCSGAFFSSEHHCGAGILVLNMTILNVKKHLTGKCCGLTAVVVTLSDELNLAKLFSLTVFCEGLFGKVLSQVWNSCHSLWKLSLCYPNNLISDCSMLVFLISNLPLLILT